MGKNEIKMQKKLRWYKTKLRLYKMKPKSNKLD